MQTYRFFRQLTKDIDNYGRRARNKLPLYSYTILLLYSAATLLQPTLHLSKTDYIFFNMSVYSELTIHFLVKN
jgi:hypothetical protein